jgi:hypothetical protein
LVDNEGLKGNTHVRMTEKFSELLSEYLDERDRQNGAYYDGRYFGDQLAGRRLMEELAAKMDALIHGTTPEESPTK